MAKVTFDGEKKVININTGETEIDAQIDLYSDWKEWVIISDNAKYEQAFRTFGGDPVDQAETQFAPRYFFLVNNWQVHANAVSVTVQLNLYTDNFVTPYTLDNAEVLSKNSDAQVILSSETSGTTELDRTLNYHGAVYIDISSAYSGTDYPKGTIAEPVNNLANAVTIAGTREATTFYVVTPNGGYLNIDQDLAGYNFIGNIFPPNINFDNVNVSNSTFDRIILTGTMSSVTDEVYIKNSFIGDNSSPSGVTNLYNFNGTIADSYINTDLYLKDGFNGQIINSNSTIGGDTHPDIWLQGTQSVNLNVANWSGGIGIHGMTQSGSVATIEVDPGEVELGNTNTDGIIIVRGVGILTNSVTGSTTIITQGFTGDIHDQLDRMDPELFDQGSDIDYIITQIDAQTENIQRILGLSQDNYRIFNQTYDSNGNMTDGTIRTYPSSTDATNDTNVAFSWDMSATYSVEGLLIDYKMLRTS